MNPTLGEINALTLEGMRDTIMAMLHPQNVEINIAGDFEPAELICLQLKYLGTIAPRSQFPVVSNKPPQFMHPQQPVRDLWHLQDSDERACAFIAGRAPARWFSFGKAVPNSPVQQPQQLHNLAQAPAQMQASAREQRRQHPLYTMVTLNLLKYIILHRLNAVLRESLGLTYHVDFEISSFDRLEAGWFEVDMVSDPSNIQDAMDAALQVMRTMATDGVSAKELEEAQYMRVSNHKSCLKVNGYPTVIFVLSTRHLHQVAETTMML